MTDLLPQLALISGFQLVLFFSFLTGGAGMSRSDGVFMMIIFAALGYALGVISLPFIPLQLVAEPRSVLLTLAFAPPLAGALLAGSISLRRRLKTRKPQPFPAETFAYAQMIVYGLLVTRAVALLMMPDRV